MSLLHLEGIFIELPFLGDAYPTGVAGIQVVGAVYPTSSEPGVWTTQNFEWHLKAITPCSVQVRLPNANSTRKGDGNSCKHTVGNINKEHYSSQQFGIIYWACNWACNRT